jgi:CheY-like chemotaxis protein
MSENPSIGVTFFGISAKEQGVFDRVLAFMAKKGKRFHLCEAELAKLFIINHDSDSIEAAIQQQKNKQIFLLLSDSEQCPIGNCVLKRPLLITRVMSVMDQCSQLCYPSDTVIKKNTPSLAKRTDSAHNRLTQAILERAKKARLAKQKLTAQQAPKTPEFIMVEGDFSALVVDDSAAIRKQLEIELRSTSIQADYAVCGEDALEKIKQKQYDLIFLDIIMPGIDGYEVCKTLRKIPAYKRTPVIMLSGKTGPLDEVEGILAGASTYLLKPVKHQHFQETLQRISKWLKNFA